MSERARQMTEKTSKENDRQERQSRHMNDYYNSSAVIVHKLYLPTQYIVKIIMSSSYLTSTIKEIYAFRIAYDEATSPKITSSLQSQQMLAYVIS